MATMRVNACIRSSWSFILLPLSELLGGISLFELRSMNESGTEGANIVLRETAFWRVEYAPLAKLTLHLQKTAVCQYLARQGCREAQQKI